MNSICLVMLGAGWIILGVAQATATYRFVCSNRLQITLPWLAYGTILACVTAFGLWYSSITTTYVQASEVTAKAAESGSQ